MLPRKGTLAIGADADIAIWDPNETRIVGDMHDAMDYNPFEGMKITGWPTTVLTRGQRVIDAGKLHAKPGDGNFIHRSRTDLTGLSGTFLPETDPKTNFGAEIFQ
jgi:dihydropyrimidinase